jgi:hypothetical protein
VETIRPQQHCGKIVSSQRRKMNGSTLFRVLAVLVLLAVVVGIGVYAYDVGVAQGIAQNPNLTAPSNGVAPYPFYGRGFFFRPFGFGFGFLGCLFPLLFFFLIFGLFRAIFWGGRWGWGGPRRWGGPGGQWENGVPSRFEEWHKRAHGENVPPSNEPQQAPK